MKKTIYMKVIMTLICSYIVPLHAQSVFKLPTLVLSTPEGSAPGEFGRFEPVPEGEPRYPSDFVVDLKGNLWILDDDNNRIQKFDRSGKFILAWKPEARWHLISTTLEMDGDGNIYIGVAPERELGVNWEIRVLNNEAHDINRLPIGPMPSHEIILRVTSLGEICIDGKKAIFLSKIGDIVNSREDIAYVFTSPFSEHLLIDKAFRKREDRWRFDKYTRLPEKNTPSISVSLDRQLSRKGRLILVDGQDNTFVLNMEEGKRYLEYYGKRGEFLGKIPECPKESKPHPISADEFFADREGNLYQMQLVPSGEQWVNIWKWEKK